MFEQGNQIHMVQGKLLQQIAKVDAAGAFTDCGTDALPPMGNVLIEELSSHVADRLASLPLTDSMFS